MHVALPFFSIKPLDNFFLLQQYFNVNARQIDRTILNLFVFCSILLMCFLMQIHHPRNDMGYTQYTVYIHWMIDYRARASTASFNLYSFSDVINFAVLFLVWYIPSINTPIWSWSCFFSGWVEFLTVLSVCSMEPKI